jgi:hypothetical protein
MTWHEAKKYKKEFFKSSQKYPQNVKNKSLFKDSKMDAYYHE